MEVSRQINCVGSTDKLLVFFGIGNNEPIRRSRQVTYKWPDAEISRNSQLWSAGPPRFKYSGVQPSCPGDQYAFKLRRPRSNSLRDEVSSDV